MRRAEPALPGVRRAFVPADAAVPGEGAAEGTVVGLDHRVGIDPGDTWHPVVAFRDADGRRRVFTERTGSNPAAYAEGDRVTVLYDPADPAEACVRSFGSLWLLPAVLAAFALVWTAVAVAAYLVEAAP